MTEEDYKLLNKPLPLTEEEYRRVDIILKELAKDYVDEAVPSETQLVDSSGNPFKYKVSHFHKDKKEHKMWWAEIPDSIGIMAFTFDKKKIYFLFSEYPYKLTKEEVEIFDKENPYWAHFFRSRKEEMKF